jgi:hypothetical protein
MNLFEGKISLLQLRRFSLFFITHGSVVIFFTWRFSFPCLEYAFCEHIFRRASYGLMLLLSVGIDMSLGRYITAGNVQNLHMLTERKSGILCP